MEGGVAGKFMVRSGLYSRLKYSSIDIEYLACSVLRYVMLLGLLDGYMCASMILLAKSSDRAPGQASEC